MAKTNTNPKVRFAGFTEDWEERELSIILKERKVMLKISLDAPILAFAAGQGVIDRSERKSNNRDHLTLDQENKIYKLTELNDIVYNPSNLKYGAIDRNKHGRGVISPIYVTFTTDEEPSFVERLVKSEKFKLRALQYEEGTVVKRQSVKPENLLSLKVNIATSKDEQKLIGNFFENIDNLITEHQQKHSKLKALKQAMLSKMFPKQGQTVPEIRFKGFEGEWKEKKLGEIGDFIKGKGLSKNVISNSGKYECVLYGHLYTEYDMLMEKINYSTDVEFKTAIKSQFGDILFPSSDTTPTGLARACCIEKEGVILGGDINILRPNEMVLGRFLSFNINANRKKLIPLIKGIAVRHIYNSDLETVEISIPNDIDEQKIIGNYFKNLDELIKNHETQITKLQNIKKALLAKMFI